MTVNISGYGASIRLIASVTFPSGIDLTQFADDADPLDVPSIQISDKAMGVNGDLITWDKANALIASLSMIPNGEDDTNLQILLDANRVAKGKRSARDIITITAIFPDGSSTTFSEGVITDGMPANAIASAGRLKTKTYSFAFQDVNSAKA